MLSSDKLNVNCVFLRRMRKRHPDYLGHNELITDRSGNPYQYFHYTAWGESFAQAEASQGSFSSSYRFNAKELDQETGNYYYGARYYHPKWSVWLSVDPLAGESPNQTPYHFVSNNPVMRIDPDGLKDWEVSEGGQITELNENLYVRNADGVVRQIESMSEKRDGETFVDKIIAQDDGSSIYVESEGMKTIKSISNSKKEEGRFIGFNNVDDAEELYKFGVEHSNVEWAFAEIDKNKNGGRSAAVVGNNEGGPSWMATVFENMYGDLAFHISHSHISTIEGASDTDMRNARDIGSVNFIRTVYDLTSGYLLFDHMSWGGFKSRGGNQRYDSNLGHQRPKK